MPTGERTDPFRTFNFQVEAGGSPLGSFSEISGLTAEGDSVDYREGNDPQPNVRKLVGMRKYTNITLKRGYTTNHDLWNWYKNILNGVADRRHVTIILLNEARQPVLSWTVENAWVNKIEGPAFKASGNEVAMESVELVHEGLMIE
jgi:phage tail-like protein